MNKLPKALAIGGLALSSLLTACDTHEHTDLCEEMADQGRKFTRDINDVRMCVTDEIDKINLRIKAIEKEISEENPEHQAPGVDLIEDFERERKPFEELLLTLSSKSFQNHSGDVTITFKAGDMLMPVGAKVTKALNTGEVVKN